MSQPVILPGSTVGVLGSGQLGRMFAIAARRMGYRVHTFSPDSDTPTGQVADVEVAASYADLDAVRVDTQVAFAMPGQEVAIEATVANRSVLDASLDYVVEFRLSLDAEQVARKARIHDVELG